MHLPENFACNTLLHEENSLQVPYSSAKDARAPQFLTNYIGREGLRNAKLLYPTKVLLFVKVLYSWLQISKLSSRPQNVLCNIFD